jgi:Mitochondrial ribosomal death-associated protein 3
MVAKDRVEAIAKMSEWEDKQDAVDELFETTVVKLKNQEAILGMHPDFPRWVERGLEEYLHSVNRPGKTAEDLDSGNDDGDVHPVFMDCYNADDGEEVVVPTILNPLQPHRHDGPGRMVEEWELSAHKKTKRILLRESTRSVARILEENAASRIYVHGRRGTGKTAVLASIVASARKSGCIVLYLPDGDRLRKNGFFVTPNAQREGMFDLQNLSQEACDQLLSTHGNDIEGMEASQETMEKYFKDTQLKRVTDYDGGAMPLVGLLRYAQERKIHAPMCYSVVVDRLMHQEEKPFLMVLDEYNCYYDQGHYFHMAYDESVREAIPYEKINLFEHAMEAMSLSIHGDADDKIAPPQLMKRGAIIVSTTESHAVPRKVTTGLTECATRGSLNSDAPIPIHVVEVPRFSDVEAEHILANFEAIGLGKLRLDRGDTIMNEQEVAFLKMSSGCIGQELLNLSVA